jgi:prepilin peptidase CpaA
MESLIVRLAMIVVGLVACGFDFRTRRIPNALTLPAATIAVVVHGVAHGMSGVGASLGGFGLGILLFLPGFALGGMGGGDVKLLAAFGAWIGPVGTAWMALYAGVAGGVMAVAVALFHGYLRQAVRNVGGMVLQWFLTGLKSIPHLTLEQQGSAPRLAYALPITVGALLSLWLR